MNPTPLAFTEEDSIAAHKEWGANCGPHALAASLGITLDRARELLPSFGGRRYTNPTMMKAALTKALGKFWLESGGRSKQWKDGIVRIQWEGKWLNPGVPARVAYQHTHFVAYSAGCVYCTCSPHEWWPVETWERIITAQLPDWPGVTGWHITHIFRIDQLEVGL